GGIASSPSLRAEWLRLGAPPREEKDAIADLIGFRARIRDARADHALASRGLHSRFSPRILVVFAARSPRPNPQSSAFARTLSHDRIRDRSGPLLRGFPHCPPDQSPVAGDVPQNSGVPIDKPLRHDGFHVG